MVGFPCWEQRCPREGTLGPSGLWEAAWFSFSPPPPHQPRPASRRPQASAGPGLLTWFGGGGWGRGPARAVGLQLPAARSRGPPQELKLGGGGIRRRQL